MRGAARGDLLLGIDAGSSVCKAGVFDLRGRTLALAARPTPLRRHAGGRVEADPQTCIEAAFEVVGEAAACCGAPERIRALGVSGAMVGAWVVDGVGRALRPGINWEDSRSQPLLERMAAVRPGLTSEIFAVSGSVLQQGCTLPVLAALREEEPGTLSRAATVLSYKDYLRAQLTGTLATDPSEAAVIPGDARAQGRSDALVSLFGLDGLAHLLPPVLPSHAVAGRLTDAAAARLGLPPGLPVVTGAGDVIATVIGAGGLELGTATTILGTTCMVGLCRDAPSFEPPDLGLLFSLAPGRWFRAMVNVAGTLNLEWATSLLAPELVEAPDRHARVEAMVAAVPPGARGVTYLPYLSESGIIAPIVDPAARAQFAGLVPGQDRACLLRAVYEGVAFAVADLVDLLGVPAAGGLTLCGGGGRSALWSQLIADATGRVVVVPEGEEFGARGAALLAAVGVGAFASVEEASRAVAGGGGRSHAPSGSDALRKALGRYREARNRALGPGRK